MSRAMNVNLTEDKVKAACKAAGISISAIEPLQSGGTRLVCTRPEEADQMRTKFHRHLIAGAVSRERFYRPPED